MWENNQNSKENPRQSTEKVIDKTQKKNGRENQRYVSRGNAICKRKKQGVQEMQSRHLRGARKRRQNRLKIQNHQKMRQQQEGRIHPEI